MATINGKTLSEGGDHSVFPQPRPRLVQSSLPSVGGVYVQRFGLGAQIISGRGILASDSRANLKTAVREIQATANNAPATYTDVDDSTHANCILVTYDQTGDIKREASDSFWVPVTWTIIKQVS